MAKFCYIEWLVTFLSSQDSFLFDWDEGNQTKSDEKHGITADQMALLVERPSED